MTDYILIAMKIIENRIYDNGFHLFLKQIDSNNINDLELCKQIIIYNKKRLISNSKKRKRNSIFYNDDYND